MPDQTPLQKSLFTLMMETHRLCREASKAADFYLMERGGRWVCFAGIAQEVKRVTKFPKWDFTPINCGEGPTRDVPQAFVTDFDVHAAIEELTDHGSVALIEMRTGTMNYSCRYYAACTVPRKGTQQARKPSDAQVRAWAERNIWDGSLHDALTAIEDAQNLPEELSEEDVI